MPKTKFAKDLTEGSVVKQLIGFSLPFFVSNTLQALYSVVDLMVVGNFVNTADSTAGTDALYVSSVVLMFMNAVIIGLTMGGNVLVAQSVGAKRLDRLKSIIGTMLSAFGIIAIVLSALLFIFAEPLLNILRTPEAALKGAVDYLSISAVGFVFLVGYNSISAVLRGMGDSVRPMFFIAVSAVLNVVLDLVFVAGLNMGMKGAAFATVLSQGTGFFLSAFYLSAKGFVFDFKPKSFRINKKDLNSLLKFGIPSAIQQSLVQGSFLAIAPLANEIGASTFAAAMSRINSLAILPAQALMTAVASMTGQNFGAGKIDRVKKVMYSAMKIIFPVALSMSAIVFLFPTELIVALTKYSGDMKTAAVYMRIGCIEYIIVSELFMLNGLLLGTGRPIVTTVNSFVNSLLVRVPLAYLFALTFGFGVYGIPMATATAPICGIAIAGGYYLSGKWKINQSETPIKKGD